MVTWHTILDHLSYRGNGDYFRVHHWLLVLVMALLTAVILAVIAR